MNTTCLPEIRVGESIQCGGATVFPLYSPGGIGTCAYALAPDAMAAGTLSVTEISEEGSVGELLAENAGDTPVLVVEGLELVGARQNRVASVSVLVGARSRTTVPVTCTEHRRWRYASRLFGAGSHCPPTLRCWLKERACRRLVRPPQTAMWEAIRKKHAALGVSSGTENLSDALETHRERADDLRHRLPCPDGAAGIAVALNGKVVCVDVFDQPSTLQKLWDRLVQGIALDALEFCDTGCWVSGNAVSVELYKRRVMVWKQVKTVGLGEAYRARGEDDSLATALVVGGRLIHLSIAMPMGD